MAVQLDHNAAPASIEARLIASASATQQQDVMAAIQRMRAKAKAAGNLKSSPEIKVVQESPQTIVIQPAIPQVVYVPTYNPTVIYGAPVVVPGYSSADVAAAAIISFGVGIAVGAAIYGGCCGWGWGYWAQAGTATRSFTTGTYTSATHTGVVATTAAIRVTVRLAIPAIALPATRVTAPAIQGIVHRVAIPVMGVLRPQLFPRPATRAIVLATEGADRLLLCRRIPETAQATIQARGPAAGSTFNSAGQSRNPARPDPVHAPQYERGPRLSAPADIECTFDSGGAAQRSVRFRRRACAKCTRKPKHGWRRQSGRRVSYTSGV